MNTEQARTATSIERVVFTIVKYPDEAQYNEGRSAMIYRDTEPVSGWLYAGKQAHEHRALLAEQYAKKRNVGRFNAEAQYTTVQYHDDVPDSDYGRREVSRDCMCVTIWTE